LQGSMDNDIALGMRKHIHDLTKERNTYKTELEEMKEENRRLRLIAQQVQENKKLTESWKKNVRVYARDVVFMEKKNYLACVDDWEKNPEWIEGALGRRGLNMDPEYWNSYYNHTKKIMSIAVNTVRQNSVKAVRRYLEGNYRVLENDNGRIESSSTLCFSNDNNNRLVGTESPQLL